MIRILQSVNIMDRAGLETMLMNYYRNMDKSKIQFDFLTHRSNIGAYEDEIKKMGGYIYHAPRLYPNNYFQYFKYMKKLFLAHPEYLIIHSHIDSMSFFPLLAAKNNAIPIRIGHSHTSKLDKDLRLPIKYASLKLMHRVANVYFACGEKAGQFMYSNKKFTVIHNAIDLKKFKYNIHIRNKMREKLNIQNSFVIGHVGRFNYIKNQMFLLDIFKEILKKESNSILIFVGKGPDEQKIREKAKKLKIESKVMLLLDRSDVADLYQVFDVFVMPSIFEGVPVVGVEAQANGLPCIFSDTISQEIILTENSYNMDLTRGAKEWAKKILGLNRLRNINAENQLREKGYDIKIEAEKLQNWYLNTYFKIQGDKTV